MMSAAVDTTFRDADLIVGVGVQPPDTTRSYYAADVSEAVKMLQQRWRFANTRVAVMVADDIPREQQEVLSRECEFLQSNNALNQRTIETVATLITRRFVAGLSRLSTVPWASQAGRPMAGAPAFIIGAGAGLDLNGHHLVDAARKGYIVAVNTSCGAVTRHGVKPDVTVAIDRSDLTSGLSRSGAGVHVLDLSSGPENWALPCDQQYAIVNNDPIYVQTAVACGAMPLSYRGTCVAAAYSLARMWGASPIVLVGQDLSFFLDDGRFYAKGTPFEDIRYRYDEKSGAIKFSGESKQMVDAELLVAEAWGGNGDVMTTTMLVDFGIWLSRAAHASGDVINATEHGIRMGGMQERKLRDLVAELPDVDKRSLVGLAKPPADQAQAEEARIHAQCARILNASSDDVQWEIEALPLLHSWIISEHFRMERDKGSAPDDKVRRLRGAALAGARELSEVLT